MIMIKRCYRTRLIPNKLICNQDFYTISLVDEEYIIDEFVIYVRNEKIERIVILKGKHPNCNPVNKEFCIPDEIKNMKFNKEALRLIENMFLTFNFNSAYFQPWAVFKIEKENE